MRRRRITVEVRALAEDSEVVAAIFHFVEFATCVAAKRAMEHHHKCALKSAK